MRKGMDYVGVCITCFCHDGKGNFVMNLRGKNARDENGRWEFMGGGLELGDKVEDTIRKEVREEYCTEVLDFEFLGYRDVHREHDGQKTHWIALDFKVLVDPNKVKNGEPHKFDDIGWFTLENLPQPQHSQLGVFLRQYGEKLRKM